MSSEKQSPTIVSIYAAATVLWGNEQYVKTSDNLRAEAQMANPNTFTDSILCTGFGFTVPDGATVDGIEIALERRANPSTSISFWAQLYSGGGVGQLKQDATTWPVNDAVCYVGGSSDLWNATLTPLDINGANFGISFLLANNAAGTVAEIDSIAITVYYTESAATVNESITMSASAAMSLTEDVGGTTYNDSITFAAEATITGAGNQDLLDAITLNGYAFMLSGHTQEEAAIRLISSTNDLYIRWQDIERMIESWKRDFQINKYADGHNRIYLRSSWRKTWQILINANDTARTFVTTLRSETGNIKFFPLYKYDKSTFYKCRVDNRLPLNYYSGQGDHEALMQVVLYEVA